MYAFYFIKKKYFQQFCNITQYFKFNFHLKVDIYSLRKNLCLWVEKRNIMLFSGAEPVWALYIKCIIWNRLYLNHNLNFGFWSVLKYNRYKLSKIIYLVNSPQTNWIKIPQIRFYFTNIKLGQISCSFISSPNVRGLTCFVPFAGGLVMIKLTLNHIQRKDSARHWIYMHNNNNESGWNFQIGWDSTVVWNIGVGPLNLKRT